MVGANAQARTGLSTLRRRWQVGCCSCVWLLGFVVVALVAVCCEEASGHASLCLCASPLSVALRAWCCGCVCLRDGYGRGLAYEPGYLPGALWVGVFGLACPQFGEHVVCRGDEAAPEFFDGVAVWLVGQRRAESEGAAVFLCAA